MPDRLSLSPWAGPAPTAVLVSYDVDAETVTPDEIQRPDPIVDEIDALVATAADRLRTLHVQGSWDDWGPAYDALQDSLAEFRIARHYSTEEPVAHVSHVSHFMLDADGRIEQWLPTQEKRP